VLCFLCGTNWILQCYLGFGFKGLMKVKEWICVFLLIAVLWNSENRVSPKINRNLFQYFNFAVLFLSLYLVSILVKIVRNLVVLWSTHSNFFNMKQNAIILHNHIRMNVPHFINVLSILYLHGPFPSERPQVLYTYYVVIDKYGQEGFLFWICANWTYCNSCVLKVSEV
jgi:hypothetical protein